MALNNRHPLYQEFEKDWVALRDFYRGERVVKAKGEEYLPATAGMHLDGMKKGQAGYWAYSAYLKRAVFHDYVREGVEALVGLLHQKPPAFELPDEMKSMLEKCTLQGESLPSLLRRINTEQILTGRIGLLADIPIAPATEDQNGKTLAVVPYIASYITEAIINWDEAEHQEGFTALNLVVLDESGLQRNTDFEWKTFKKYRVLQLGDILKEDPDGTAEYSAGVFTNSSGADLLNYSPAAMSTPMIRGVTLKQIPFVFINTKDITAAPDDPPLTGLAQLSLAIYRGEADYRQTLFLQGQDTLVVMGGTRAPEADPTTGDQDAIRTGAGSRIDLDLGGDAKYIGVSGDGLTEQREALQNDKEQAGAKAGRLIPVGKKDAESGQALKTRITAQTATLNQIALTGAKGLENLLKICATWLALDPDKVKVTPNLEFGDFDAGTKDFVDLMTARAMGLPISRQSIHEIMVDRGLTQMSYEDEVDLIEEENATMPPAPGTVGGPSPAVDPHLTDQNGDPLNKNDLQIQSEQRQAKRDAAAAKLASKSAKNKPPKK